MRVTTTTPYLTMTAGLNASLERVQDLQNQLSSGKRINNYSDAPSDAVNALRLRAQTDDWAAWSRAATDASGRLDVADSTLQSASSIMQRIKELTVGAVNGSIDPAGRTAMAQEVTQLRDEMADLANTHHLGSSIFGGFASNAVANVGGTWTYVGDSGQVKRQVGSNVVVQVNIDGRQAFGFNGPGPDVFTALDNLAADIQSGNTAGLQTDSADLDNRATDISTALGSVGALVNRVDQAVQQGQTITGQLQSERSQLEDVDLTQAVMQLTMAQSGYQAALGAAAKANLPSLASFLR